MNQINALIVEGKIKEVKNCEIKEVNKSIVILETERFHSDENGNKTREVYYFKCEVWGAMTKIVQKKEDKNCRIVGRMKQNRFIDESGKNCSEIVIVAEHIDIKM